MSASRVSWSILTPLIAAVVSWSLFMVGVYTELFVESVINDNNVFVGTDPAVPASTYIFFAAVAVFAIAALWGQRRAIRERVQAGPTSRPERSAHRFTTLALIIAMVVAAVLAISEFLMGFNTGDRQGDLVLRVFNVYLPIVLYTALVVTVLLMGFVFRSDTLPKSPDPEPEVVVSDDERTGGQRDLGAAYAIPIVATAIALIFGLVVYDATGQSLEVWIWVVIQILIGTGIVAGTVFAERAVAQGPTSISSRSRVTRGARGLSFVLSIVFSGVVGLMGFGYGGSAIDSLRVSTFLQIDLSGPNSPLAETDVNVTAYDVREGSKVGVMIEPIGEVVINEEVVDSDYFFQSRPLPGDLAADDYVLVMSAVSVDGRALSRQLNFSVTEENRVAWDTEEAYFDRWEGDDAVVISTDGRWWVEDFLPALVLFLLAVSAVYLTLTERNRPARGLPEPSR